MGIYTKGSYTVEIPDLSDSANIVEAFETFAGAGTQASGVLDHLSSLKTEIDNIKSSNVNEFDSSTFRITTASATKKLAFDISQLTGNTTIYIPSAPGNTPIVTESGSAVLANKTMSATGGNIIDIVDNNFTLSKNGEVSVKTKLAIDSAWTTAGSKTLYLREPSGATNEYLVYENLAQTLNQKTLKDYREQYVAYDATYISQNTTQSHSVSTNGANIVYVKSTSMPSNGTEPLTLALTGVSIGSSVIAVFQGGATGLTINPAITVNGTTVKWSGGNAPGSLVGSSPTKYAMYCVTAVYTGSGTIYLGSYLGDFS